MNDPISYTTAFMIGLLGGAHCIGMCGGIMNALSFAIPDEQRNGLKLNIILLSYNVGRIFSYVVAGVIIGSLGWLLQSSLGPASGTLRFLAGLMLIAMGLYLAGWWMGLTYIERAGGKLWQYLEPFGKRLMPVTRPGQALFLGAIWGWLPCGMVYSVLTWSAAAANWQQSALIMLCFGLGTLPVMFVTGHFAHTLKSFIQKKTTRSIAAILMIVFGVWTMMGAKPHSDQHQHSGHEMPQQEQSIHDHHDMHNH